MRTLYGALEAKT